VRSLSLKLQSELKTDHSFFEEDTKGLHTKRHYELDIFNCIQTQASDEEIKIIRKNDILSRLSKFFSNNGITIFNEKSFSYDPGINKLSGDVYLNGFWQSEKYFKDIREILLKEFSLKVKLSGAAESLKNKISSDEQSVSIHFRRGDYVHLASAIAHHGAKDLDYYSDAITSIKQFLNDPSFYIFSDDINWVKENFKIENAPYVEGLKSHEDLELMKTCQHNITANSSFSWWGAWLNNNPEKKIIAPKQWFKDPSINTTDLIPASWLRV